ncbi:MAG: hypothetical protein IPI53_11365 [Saprospiraceae bacterium]|nr:hypothetical protein [Saprospiraceae bacterium]
MTTFAKPTADSGIIHIVLLEGTTYTLSVWARNMDEEIPTLFWTVNGTQVGTSISPTSSAWVQLTTTWTATTTGTATFAIVLAQNHWLRDFVLDDVYIAPSASGLTYSWSGPTALLQPNKIHPFQMQQFCNQARIL